MIAYAAKTFRRSSYIRRSYSQLLKASLGRSQSLYNSVSACLLSFLGIQMILNLYLERIRDQCIWRFISFYIIIKYSKFLQLIWISKPFTPFNSASYSSKQRIIANSSLLWISQLYSTRLFFFKKKAYSTHRPLFISYYNVPLMHYPNKLVLIQVSQLKSN